MRLPYPYQDSRGQRSRGRAGDPSAHHPNNDTGRKVMPFRPLSEATRPGFEPGQREPKSLVLPLHYRVKNQDSLRIPLHFRDFRLTGVRHC